MLIRPSDDASVDEARWREFVERQAFGHFVASGRERAVPVVVPTQFLLEGDRVVFHVAAANPVLLPLQENDAAVMSVAGDWVYVPGSWKAIGDEDPRFGIPTTYHAAVQLVGRAVVTEDPAAVADVLRRQLDDLEPGHEYVDPASRGAKLRGLRGIEMTIDEVRAKFKFGGNVDQAHRDHVASQLRRRQAPGDAAALGHLLGHGGHDPADRPR